MRHKLMILQNFWETRIRDVETLKFVYAVESEQNDTKKYVETLIESYRTYIYIYILYVVFESVYLNIIMLLVCRVRNFLFEGDVFISSD